MALKERVEQTIADLGMVPKSVLVIRDHMEHGVPSWKITAAYTSNSGTLESQWTLAKANGMTEDHILKVIASYLKAEPLNHDEEVEL